MKGAISVLLAALAGAAAARDLIHPRGVTGGGTAGSSASGVSSTAPTSTPTPPPGYSTTTIVYLTTITTEYPVWSPQSTPVATSGGSTYYSTWASYNYVTTSYTTLVTTTSYVPPSPSACPPAVTYYVTVTQGAAPAPVPDLSKHPYDPDTVVTTIFTNGASTVETITKSHDSKTKSRNSAKTTSTGSTSSTGSTTSSATTKSTSSGTAVSSGTGIGTGSSNPTGAYHPYRWRYARKADPKKMW